MDAVLRSEHSPFLGVYDAAAYAPPPVAGRAAARMAEERGEGIAEFYEELSEIWEMLWGEHMHHGFYNKDASISLSDHRLAQLRMVEEALAFARITGLSLLLLAGRYKIFCFRIRLDWIDLTFASRVQNASKCMVNQICIITLPSLTPHPHCARRLPLLPSSPLEMVSTRLARGGDDGRGEEEEVLLGSEGEAMGEVRGGDPNLACHSEEGRGRRRREGGLGSRGNCGEGEGIERGGRRRVGVQ